MSEFENKNLLREYNIDLCKRIKDVVEEKSPEFYKSGNESFRSKIFLRYGFNTSFALAVLYSAGASEFVEDIPPDFKYPMVHYVRSDYNPHADPVIYQTSLGDFPSMVMDSEGNIHNVYNHIFLDCNGETLK